MNSIIPPLQIRIATPPIERITAKDLSAFDQHVAAGTPCIIADDPSVRRVARSWTLDYLAQKHPTGNVTVAHSPTDDVWRWKRESMPFTRYLQLIRSRGTDGPHSEYFLAEIPLAEAFPNTAAELNRPAALQGHRIQRTVVFAGINTLTRAHYHGAPIEALLVHLSGQKEVSLYPSRQLDLLKPYPWYSIRSHWSQLSRAGLTHLETDATEFRCVLEPGEILFIPQGWFHFARGLDESISVTYFFYGQWRNALPRIAIRDAASHIHKRLLLPLKYIWMHVPKALAHALRRISSPS